MISASIAASAETSHLQGLDTAAGSLRAVNRSTTIPVFPSALFDSDIPSTIAVG